MANSYLGPNNLGGNNSFRGTNSLTDPNRLTQLQENQRFNLGGLEDKGLAGLLAKDVNATSPNSYTNRQYTTLGALNKAAADYSTIDQSGWMEEYKNSVNPFLAGRSSLNSNIGYAKNDQLGGVEKALTTTGIPQGFTQRQLDAMRYELLDPSGKSVATQYYDVDDVLRHQYRGKLQGVGTGSMPTDYQTDETGNLYDPLGRFTKSGDKDPWITYLEKEAAKQNANPAPRSLGYMGYYEDAYNQQPKTAASVYKELIKGALPDPDHFWGGPAQKDWKAPTMFKWGESLYENKADAEVARETQIKNRPGQYRNLMEKYEAAGEGGLDPQSWKGGYGANNAFSGESAITQLGGKAWMKVDPSTGQWSTAGYKIDPASLAPEAMRDFGYTQAIEQGKQKKGGLGGFVASLFSGGLSRLVPQVQEQFDPMPYDGKRVTEYGGNQVYRDYGANAEALKSLLKKNSSGELVISNEDLAKIPEFYNKNTHDYNTRSENIKVPNTKALQTMTIAGAVGDYLFPQYTWGGGAAGSQAIWTRANREAIGDVTGEKPSLGSIHQTGLKNWAKGALASWLGGQGADAGAAAGTAVAGGSAAANAATYAAIGSALGRAAGSGLGSAAGTAIDTGSMNNFGSNLGTGALAGLVSSGLGAAGQGIGRATGIDPRIMGALTRMASGAVNSKIRGSKMSDKAWAQLAINSALSGMRPQNTTSQYTE